MRNTATNRSAASELGIQMDRAVRPAEASLKAAEARVVQVKFEADVAEFAFRLADIAYQRTRAKGESEEWLARFEAERERTLADKRIAAKRLARVCDLREQAAKRLTTAEAHAERLRKQAGLDRAESRRAATAPIPS